MDDAIRKKCGKRTTKLQKEEIVSKYLTGKYSCRNLGIIYNVSHNMISRILKENSVKIISKTSNKFYFNEKYFDIIDTEYKAYFLGLLYADGCNFPPRNTINLVLQESDKHILEIFNEELCLKRPLSFRTFKNNKKFKNANNVYGLHIYNKYMSEQLSNLGCVQKKSLILEFPSTDIVPENLQRHFIRGYFDGDGCIYVGKRKYNGKYKVHEYDICTISILSTYNMCTSISNILQKLIDVELVINIQPIKNSFLLTIGNKDVIKVLNLIYKNSTIYINRKYNKYILASNIERFKNDQSITTN